ncbi:hypothetical protein BDN72DRAFT_721669, partial [Pluteus cervinus]
THTIFDVICSVFDRSTDILTKDVKSAEKARALMVKIVNSLSAKMEMGAPMIGMYLLENPDHYTDHTFRPLYWQRFVTEAKKPWNDSDIIGVSNVNDYVHRPGVLENITLYEFFSRCEREKSTVDDEDMDIGEDCIADWSGVDPGLYQFLSSHPLAKSHQLRLSSPNKECIPNFVGATLPRNDRGDKEYYCLTMLVLFQPWRTGSDLRAGHETWEDAYDAYSFKAQHCLIIKYLNIRHECLDAADDYSAQMRA